MNRNELINLSKDELIDIIINNSNVNSIKYNFKNIDTSAIASSLDEFDVPILITDANFENNGPFIVYCNKGFEKVSGYSKEELIGKSPRILQGVNTDSATIQKLKHDVQQKGHFRGSAVNYKKDGSEFYNQWGIEPIKDNLGNITHYISMHTDITELKNKEEELLHQINQKNTFFSIISHDLRNPLTGFLTLTSLIKDKSGDLTFNKLLELITTLNNAAQNLNELLGNLLIWSKTQTVGFEVNLIEFKVLDKINNILKLYDTLLKGKNLEVNVNIDCNQMVYSDPFIFDTIIRNLVSNAIKFSNENSEIKITSEFNESNLFINVIDQGVGIKEETIPLLFNIENKITTLGTNREKGTGLGLKLCKELANNQNADILVNSELGKGSTFSLIINNNFRKSIN